MPVFAVDGGLIGVLGIGHDLTGRKRIEQRLQMAKKEVSKKSKGS